MVVGLDMTNWMATSACAGAGRPEPVSVGTRVGTAAAFTTGVQSRSRGGHLGWPALTATLAFLSLGAGPTTVAMTAQDSRRVGRDETFEAYVRTLQGGPISVVSFDELAAALDDHRIVVLGGYSGLDYEHPDVLESLIRALVERNGPRTAYVIGGTEDGIGRAYEWIPAHASELGLTDIKTAGIVSRNAAEYGVAEQDYVVFVDTEVDDWEVVVDGRSLMVEIARRSGGEMVYYRGGRVAGAEIGEGLELGVPVTLYTGEGVAPNAEKLAKKREKDADYVADGTTDFARAAHAGLTVVTVGEDGRLEP